MILRFHARSLLVQDPSIHPEPMPHLTSSGTWPDAIILIQINDHGWTPSWISQHGPASGGDPPDLLPVADEPVPHLLDDFPDMLGAVGHPVGEVAVLQDRKQRLDGVQFGTVGRQPQQGDVGRNLKVLRPVQPTPSSPTSICLPAGTASPMSRRWRFISAVLALAQTYPMVVPVPGQAAENRWTCPWRWSFKMRGRVPLPAQTLESATFGPTRASSRQC